MKEITGVQIYYYFVCKRKLWYFIKNLQMEDSEENVILGKIIDENSYMREDKHININNVINIDYIKDDILCETKKSNKIEEASIMQLKYYLYYLKKNGADGFTGEINYPTLKKKVEVVLSEEDENRLEEICKEILIIAHDLKPERFQKKAICKKCAYHDFCFI